MKSMMTTADAAALADDDRRRRRRHEAGARVGRVDRRVRRDAAEAERRGEREGDGEPDHAAEEVALAGRRRRRGDGGLPVRLVDEDGAEVADGVDHAEHEAVVRHHREVRAALARPRRPWCANDALSHSTTAPGVRPYFESIPSGTVRFTFKAGCSGCPSAGVLRDDEGEALPHRAGRAERRALVVVRVAVVQVLAPARVDGDAPSSTRGSDARGWPPTTSLSSM